MSSARVLFGLDALLLLIAAPFVLWFGTSIGILASARESVLFAPANLLMFFAMGLYRRDAMVALRRTMTRVPVIAGMGAILAVGGNFLASLVWQWPVAPPRDWADLGAQCSLVVILFSFAAMLARILFRILLRGGLLHRHLLVIGAGARAWDLLFMLRREGSTLNDVIVFLHEPSMGPVDPRLVADPRAKLVSGLSPLQAAYDADADQIVVAPDERRGMDLELLLACKKSGFPVIQYLSFVEKEIRRVDLKRIELGWLLYSEGFQFDLVDRILKRSFDLVVSTLVLALMSPFLAIAMLAIRVEGPGAVLYRQTRVTRDGKHFQIMKLRTMRVNAEAGGAVWARKNDDRITRSGHFLRRTRIDELPQLINILKGEMSFVGPRPERPEFAAELAAQIPLYNERHMVKAGLTGWAQINYPYGASVDDARSKLSYDLYYVKNFSILFDFVILLQTLRVVLWPSGVR
ncbi:MAG: TIGR03013 family PEP-CTERM/XrtA system glycosyltransferase [Alphaproteobacteria bacterium]|nr:TIGR03013 family PEP-CTERM/XrtA system glycosyltransferase [Alphaproteobacteria bacterium]